MKKIKRSLFVLVLLGSLFFVFVPEVIPENYQFQDFLNLAAQNDVIIIFNSGGWGNTPLEKAEDFTPIIEEIQEVLNEWGYSAIVIPYNRTKNTLTGKLTGVKDFLSSFNFSSEILAKDLEFLTEISPDKKIIMAGLSSGATFVTETYEKVSERVKGSVYTIVVGAPFWTKTFESDNVLQLNNNGRDSLANGDIKSLVSSLIRAPFKWISAKINGQNFTFSQAIRVPGHQYFWDSPEVGSQIITFLEDKIR
jgi:pimeloyl-ACP methyl ester carboxylesterase